jgi:hypothetical protein
MKRIPRQLRFPAEQAMARASDAFVADLQVLIQKATQEALRQALSRQPSPGRPAGASPAAPAAALPPVEAVGKRRQQAAEKLADTLLEYIEAHPGQRLDEISTGLGQPAKELAFSMQILLRENHLRVVGEGEATAYYAR